MARMRRRNDQRISLFPFLDILSGVIGTFFLIIAGMTVLSIESAVQIVQLPTAEAQQKRPFYVECRENGVFIPRHPTGYLPSHDSPSVSNEQPLAEPSEQGGSTDQPTPTGTFVPLDLMDTPESEWQQQLDILSEQRVEEYLILLMRREGLASFRKALAAAQARGIDVGYSPVAAGGDIVLEMPPAPPDGEDPSEDEDALDFELGSPEIDDQPSSEEDPRET